MDLWYLSTAFYNKYKDCPEILTKGETRPYIILLVEVENNKFAIPIRTHLPNIKDRYITNPITNSGLDYTKAVVISSEEYIDTSKYPEIEHKEYNYIKFKEREIKKAFSKFIAEYKKDYLRHKKNPSIPESSRFKYTALQYFKKELCLENE